jgi:hypothetical protein
MATHSKLVVILHADVVGSTAPVQIGMLAKLIACSADADHPDRA